MFYDAVLTVFPRDILISVADKASYKNLRNIVATLKPQNIILDSGAFTVWNSGGVMTLDDVISSYEKALKVIDNKCDAYLINLDVIPGSKGNKPTKQEAATACEQSWQNYLVLKEKFSNVLPVFHEDDDFEYLYKMMKETNYIAISPANDSSTKKRMIWLDKVYSILKADYKTHGLAATSEKIMQRYPFYSVDSINWKVIVMFANSKIHKNKQLISKLAKDKNTRTQAITNELQYYMDSAKKITRLWESRGVIWKD